VKFKDADLVGFPLRVNLGEKSLARGEVEIKPRAGAAVAVKQAEAAARVVALVQEGLKALGGRA
jgi:prolyl-tRNA synthetase